MPLTLSQVPGRLEVVATWSFTPAATVIVGMTLRVRSSANSFLTPVAIVTPTANVANGSETIATAAPPFAAGQQVRATLEVLYASLTTPSQTISTTADIILAAGTPVGPPIPGLPTGAVRVPELDTALAPFTPQLASATRLAGRVAGTAAAYRSTYLRTQAVALTEQAMRVESRIAELQALDVQKMTAAQLLAYPALSSALGSITSTTGAPLPLPDLTGEINRLGGAVRDLVLLQRILDWLARTDILDFWYGLFRTLTEDVAGLRTELPRTRAYLATVFRGSFAGAIDELYALAAVDAEGAVDALSGAVRAALSAATGSILAETRQLYASIDAPLLAAPLDARRATPPGPDDVLDPNPLATALWQLDQAVDQQLQSLRSQATAAVRSLNLQQAEDLFVALAVTYVCLPLLAAIGIAAAGGPASAALLTAAVFVAGQELVHLVAKWLGGPLGEQLDGLRSRVDAARRALEAAVAAGVTAATTSLLPLGGAAQQLQLSGLFLRELSHLVPDVFLSATADLLGRKRDELLRRASELALAAELAQGHEYGTVFDAIRPTYFGLAPGRLPDAPQLPGGSSPTRHVAETLLADLHRLDEQRLELVDGKQMRVTRRISLADLAGQSVLGLSTPAGTATTAVFTRLLRGEPVAVRLDEGDLLDGTHPGAYRALIDDVRVFAQVVAPVSTAAQIPVLITHAGVSRTRVRRPGGAAEGFSEQALRLLFSPAVCEAAYRRALAGAARVGQILRTSFSWRFTLAEPLWDEVLRAAATEELVDIRVMERDWGQMLWQLGFPGLVNAEAADPGVVRQMVFVQASSIVFSGLFGNPLGAVQPAHGDPANRTPGDAQITQWAEALSRTLVERGAQLAQNPIRPFRKWGGQVRILEEIDPALRDVGFLTLERVHEPEAQTFQLAPDPTAALSTAAQLLFQATPAARADGIPPEQLRPFENLGLTTTLLVQLPGAVGQAGGLYDTVSPKIRDVVLEVDVRVYHDAELESAIRASRRRAGQMLTLAGSFNRGPLVAPDAVGITEVAPAPRRILQLSLRALRDRSLIAWKQAREALAARGLTGFDPAEGITAAQVDALQPLGSGDPLLLLTTATPPVFTIRFGRAAPASLGALGTELTIDPEQLGIGDDLFALLSSLPVASTGAVHALGIAVVPMRQGFNRWGAGTITVGQALTPLFAGVAPPPWPISGSWITSGRRDAEGSAGVVPLPDLFADPARSSVVFEFGRYVPGLDAPPNARPDPIYDIIVTVAYSPPVVQLAPATSALL